MLSEIIGATVEAAPEMKVVPGVPTMAELGEYTRRRRIDAVIFASGNQDFAGETITGLLRSNPRLCLVAVDGRDNQATAHFLAPSRAVFPGLEASTLTAAMQAGTRMRLR